ncbi:hypothetical protein Hanom_Chr11g01011661 [Helianthus anomalus]
MRAPSESTLFLPILNKQLVLEPQLGPILKGARVPICTSRNQICFYFVDGSRCKAAEGRGLAWVSWMVVVDGGCNGSR